MVPKSGELPWFTGFHIHHTSQLVAKSSEPSIGSRHFEKLICVILSCSFLGLYRITEKSIQKKKLQKLKLKSGKSPLKWKETNIGGRHPIFHAKNHDFWEVSGNLFQTHRGHEILKTLLLCGSFRLCPTLISTTNTPHAGRFRTSYPGGFHPLDVLSRSVLSWVGFAWGGEPHFSSPRPFGLQLWTSRCRMSMSHIIPNG